MSFNTSESVLLKIFYSQPRVIDVFVDDVRVAAMTSYPNLTSSRGGNVLDPQSRTLYLVLRGSASGISRFDLKTTNAIQVTMTISMSEAQFSGENFIENLA